MQLLVFFICLVDGHLGGLALGIKRLNLLLQLVLATHHCIQLCLQKVRIAAALTFNLEKLRLLLGNVVLERIDLGLQLCGALGVLLVGLVDNLLLGIQASLQLPHCVFVVFFLGL